MKICPTCRYCFEDTETVCPNGDHGPLAPARHGSRVIADRYRLDRLLGRGGMGAVYAGTHIELDRPAAIKLLLPDLVSDTQALERFRREARAAARLNHPNVADTYDYGILPGGEAYIIMELVVGHTLREYINASGALDFGEGVAIARQVADGIEAAHRSGIIHRDLKPSNIILARDHDDALQPKVVDFGIAKLKEHSTTGGVLTNTGSLLGTPRYMSPEQCAGHEIDARADIYSLGVILYEMLAGRPPFDAPSATAIALKHVQEPPVPLGELRPDAPEGLAALVMRALEKEPGARPQTAAELARALRPFEHSFGVAHAGATQEQNVRQSSLSSSTTGGQALVTPRETATSSHEFVSTTPSHHAPTVPPAEGGQPPTGRSGAPTLEEAGGERESAAQVSQQEIDARVSEQESASRVSRPQTETITQLASLPAPSSPSASNALAERSSLKEAGTPGAQTIFAGGHQTSSRRPALLIFAALAFALLLGLFAWLAPWRTQTTNANSTPNTHTVNSTNGNTPAAVNASHANANAASTPAGTDARDAAPSSDEGVAVGAPEAERRALDSALAAWLAASNARDVNSHLAFYAPQLQTYYLSANVPLAAVRRDKSAALTQAASVRISADAPSVTFRRDGRTAVMEFRKQYDIVGGTINGSGEVVQELIWQKTRGGWKIISERDKRVLR